ncbi:class F sortase [Dietzia cinnamea]|uniref:class F sortase n=1 Tax=Dietzia cinnamea TaxID=321318 RepID=UPI0021A8D782|nr:class F sortase [Dietzia cinnamea]MCT2146777.1 class F sortase [Dietzia cinnamea]
MVERSRVKCGGESGWRRGSGVLGLLLAVAMLSVGAMLFFTDEPASPVIDPNPPRPSAQGTVDSAPLANGDQPAPPMLPPETLSLGPLGVTAPILNATVLNGVLTPPLDVTQVGKWVDGARLESDSGTVLIAGHVNMSGQGNGALFNLARIRPGEFVHTSDEQGAVTTWRVTNVVERPKADGVEESVLDGPEGPRRLAVVTCGGDLEYINGIGDYEDNVYLYADHVN